MDKWQAQYQLWSSFGVPAYDASSVPSGNNKPEFPYITYEGVDGTFNSDVFVNVSIWTRDYSWTQANTISDRIYQAIKNGGTTVKYDGGFIWATAEDTFSRNMGDPDDDLIRRKLLNIILHFV